MQNNRTVIMAAIIIALAAAAGLGYWYGKNKSTEKTADQGTELDNNTSSNSERVAAPTMPAEERAPHFVNSTPAHQAALTASPAEVKISFDTALTDKSSITMLLDDEELALDDARVSADKKTLSVGLETDIGDGIYTVEYNACWTADTCDTGVFGFTVTAPNAE